jgi:hypothetical protein
MIPITNGKPKPKTLRARIEFTLKREPQSSSKACENRRKDRDEEKK